MNIEDWKKLFAAVIFFLLFSASASAQMRKIYLDQTADDNHILKLSFHQPSEGFVAFTKYIGFTADSGRSFSKRYITVDNVDYNGYLVNLTFGFKINGVHSFNSNNLIVYGHYGFVPAILVSGNGGVSFKVVYYSVYNSSVLSTGIMDLAFAPGSNTGYAVDADRILKTTNGGQSWSISRTEPQSNFNFVQAIYTQYAYVASISYNSKKVLKTEDGGYLWTWISAPGSGGKITSMFVLNVGEGWVGVEDQYGKKYIYKMGDNGGRWTTQNHPDAMPFAPSKLFFTDSNTGYALSDQNTVYKTVNSGMTWEPLPRDNNYAQEFLTHNTLFFASASQFWAGGGKSFLEISTNAGGTPVPKSYFRIDTLGLWTSGNVKLYNYSRADYTYAWFVNGTPVSTQYNASYIHDVNLTSDTIMLIVSNGIKTDTAIKYQRFNLPVVLNSFSPSGGLMGTVINITGSNFGNVFGVKFGGVPATYVQVVSSTLISAVVGSGASGTVSVITSNGTGSLPGFTFYPPPKTNLPVTVSDSILCKAESTFVTIHNAEPNVHYQVTDSLNTFFGEVNCYSAGDVTIKTNLITRTGNYRILANIINISSNFEFAQKIFIKVENTKAMFSVNRMNATVGEQVIYANRSSEADSARWTFFQDASIGSSIQVNPPAINYASPGQKTLRLISTSKNGCTDTITADAIFVYEKAILDSSCFVMNVKDTNIATGYGVEKMNRIAVCHDNGFLISGFGFDPVLKSRIGAAKQFPTKNIAFVAKYTSRGVLSWSLSLSPALENNGKFTDVQVDALGNIYVLGNCRSTTYLTLPNGDSMRISATPDNAPGSLFYTINGFILKLDPLGNYMWHTILSYPKIGDCCPTDPGGLPTRISINGNQIGVAGRFTSKLAYVKNGIINTLYTLYSEGGGGYDFFIKISPEGNLLWHMYFETDNVNEIGAIKGIGIDKMNNFYVSGNYEASIDIHDVGNINYVRYEGQTGKAGGYLLKFDSTGRLLRKVNMVNSHAIEDYIINGHVTTAEGTCYLTGEAQLQDSSRYILIQNADGSTKTFILGSYFLMKFDSSGIYKWGVGSWKSGWGGGYGVDVSGNNIYTTGFLSMGNTDSSSFTFTSMNGSNIRRMLYKNEFFIANYDTSGNLKKLVTSGANYYYYFRPNKILVDKTGSLLVSGTSSAITGGITPAMVFNNAVPIKNTNGFFCKLNLDYCAGNCIKNTWTGAWNNRWENPMNWSCQFVPDINSNVVIKSGTVILNSNAAVHSLSLYPTVNFSVAPGYTLTITK